MNSAGSNTPLRPHIPFVLILAGGMWASVAVIYPSLREVSEIDLNRFQGAGLFACAVSCALMAIAHALVHATERSFEEYGQGARQLKVLQGLRSATFFFAGISCGAFIACHTALSVHDQEARLLGSPHTWTFTFLEDAKQTKDGYKIHAEAVNEQNERTTVRILLNDQGAALLCRQELTAQGSLKAPSDKASDFYWTAGIAGIFDATHLDVGAASENPLLAIRHQSIERIGAYENGELLSALVCGWRLGMEQSGSYEFFKTAGLAHIVAVSGAHLALVTLFVTTVLGALGLSRGIRVGITLGFLIGYVFFTGMPVSALRAALMAASALLSLIADRRSSALNALGLCIVVFIALEPTSCLSASFILSAGSTLGIIVFAPLLIAPFYHLPQRLKSLVVEPLALTAASSLVTLPYAAALFAQVPLVAPLANIIATPLFTLACTAGFVLVVASVCLSFLAPFAIPVGILLTQPLLLGAQAAASIPYACIPADVSVFAMVVLSVVICLVLYWWWPMIRPIPLAICSALAAALVAALLVVVPLRQADEIIMFNVGQGDAFLIRSQGAALLMDTGNQSSLLKEACARHAVFRLDAVAISHGDDDHCASLTDLAQVVEIDHVIVAKDALTCNCSSCRKLMAQAGGDDFQAVRGYLPGDAIHCGKFTLTCVWPYRYLDEGGNADSLSFLCEYDAEQDGVAEWSTLFCGDAETRNLNLMADDYFPQGIDVLKCAHHGSKTGLDEATAERLHPSIALISTGADNRYGHPHAQVLDALDSVACRTYRTDTQGDVTLSFSAEAIQVTTQIGEEGNG